MAIVQVKDATGSVLDWMVGVAQSIPNLHVVKKHKYNCVYGMVLVEEGNFIDFPWKPSTSWDQGGPIIEREKIELIPPANESDLEWVAVWYKCEDAGMQGGTSPLIAAMRCYVTSKLGDTVEVPDELI